MRLVPLIFAGCIALLMAVVQYLALDLYWYWTYWWLDIVMHGAGGVVIGLLVYTYVSRRFAYVCALTLAIGVLWEVFEFTLGISVSEPNFVSDSTIDLVMDLVGCVCAYGIMGQWEAFIFRLTAAHGASPDQIS